MGGTYVYGVVGSGSSIRLPEGGIEAAPVELVEEGQLSAVTSDLSRDRVAGSRKNLSAHASVLEQIAAQDTVLPMRFGMILPSARNVREGLLRGRSTVLRGLLARLDGLVEFRVRALYREGEPFREIAAGSRTIRELRERVRAVGEDAGYFDRIRLGEHVANE